MKTKEERKQKLCIRTISGVLARCTSSLLAASLVTAILLLCLAALQPGCGGGGVTNAGGDTQVNGTGLRGEDVLFTLEDPVDPSEEELYLGAEVNGRRRFISSSRNESGEERTEVTDEKGELLLHITREDDRFTMTCGNGTVRIHGGANYIPINDTDIDHFDEEALLLLYNLPELINTAINLYEDPDLPEGVGVVRSAVMRSPRFRLVITCCFAPTDPDGCSCTSLGI